VSWSVSAAINKKKGRAENVLFSTRRYLNGAPITDRIIEASIQCAERIMQRIDSLHSK
jgi:hypothetical protein